jgi:hypothetical protein
VTPEALLAHLRATRERLLSEVAAVSDADFVRRPVDERWCVAEVVEHLANVEARVTPLLRDLVEGRRVVKVSWLDRLRRLPPRLGELRLFKIRATRLVAPQRVPGRGEVLERLTASRAALLGLLEDCRGRDVSRLRLPHRVLGAQDVHGWAQFIGHHEERHRKQIVEIREDLARAASA